LLALLRRFNIYSPFSELLGKVCRSEMSVSG